MGIIKILKKIFKSDNRNNLDSNILKDSNPIASKPVIKHSMSRKKDNSQSKNIDSGRNTKKNSLDKIKNYNSYSDQKVIKVLNLFKNGKYYLTDVEPLDGVDIFIKIYKKYENGFLLQCYENGFVNKVKVSSLLSKKIDYEYSDGLNTEANIKSFLLIEKDEILGIFFSENRKRLFKAHLTSNISSRESLNLKGFKLIYNDNFILDKYTILPYNLNRKINRLVFTNFTAMGKTTKSSYYLAEHTIINNYLNSKKNSTDNIPSVISKPLKVPTPLSNKLDLIDNSSDYFISSSYKENYHWDPDNEYWYFNKPKINEPILKDRIWEDIDLFWSSSKKEGYSYHPKQDSWYKKKQSFKKVKGTLDLPDLEKNFKNILFNQIKKAFKNEEYQYAISLSDKYMEKYNAIKVVLIRGKSKKYLKDLNGSIEDFEFAIKLARKKDKEKLLKDSLKLCALTKQEIKDYINALNLFYELKKITPNDPKIYEHIAELKKETGDNKGYEVYLNEALKLKNKQTD